MAVVQLHCGCRSEVIFENGGRRITCKPHGQTFVVSARKEVVVRYDVREITEAEATEDG